MSVNQYQLTVRKGPTVGEIFPLDLPIMTLGRDPIADIVINDPEISRQHTRFTRTPDGFSVQDLGSTNGTFVDGERIGGDAVQLHPNQTISIGSGVTLFYEQIEAPYQPDEYDTEDPADAFFYVPNEPGEPEEIIENVSYNEPVYQNDPVYTSPPQYPVETPPNNNRRNIIIVASILLILCCCCSFLAFMWFYGGDWMLEQMGLIQ